MAEDNDRARIIDSHRHWTHGLSWRSVVSAGIFSPKRVPSPRRNATKYLHSQLRVNKQSSFLLAISSSSIRPNPPYIRFIATCTRGDKTCM